MADLTPAQTASLKHHSMYGRRRRGTPPATKRTTSSDWKTKPFQTPMAAAWDRSIPRSELRKLLQGFKPDAMEDKWFVYADGPDEQRGDVVVHMHRSWTGYKMVELRLEVEKELDGGVEEKEGEGEAEAEEGCGITEITWEAANGVTEEEAREIAKGVCVWCLGARIP